MGATLQGYGGSQLSCEANQIVIRLPRQVFGQAWAALVAFLLGASGQQQVISNSQQVMTRRGAGEDAPRWKQAHLDVFSWLLFLLKVPADHPLVALWQTIPWATINQICAPLYHNAHGGRLAWAPAQMVALLVLMFFYGVTYESRTLAWVQENVVWAWFCGFGDGSLRCDMREIFVGSTSLGPAYFDSQRILNMPGTG